jgi:PKD repeat protein
VPLVFGVSSTATGVTWQWNFGDGASAQTTAFSTAHAYGAAGIYTATVSSAGTPSASATIAVIDPSAPAPPASSAGLVISLTCTPANHGPTTPTSCNVSATYHGASLFSTAISKVDWDWGDGISHIVNGSPVDTHVYAQAGTYLIVPNVTANTVDGPKMTTTSKSVIIQ